MRISTLATACCEKGKSHPPTVRLATFIRSPSPGTEAHVVPRYSLLRRGPNEGLGGLGVYFEPIDELSDFTATHERNREPQFLTDTFLPDTNDAFDTARSFSSAEGEPTQQPPAEEPHVTEEPSSFSSNVQPSELSSNTPRFGDNLRSRVAAELAAARAHMAKHGRVSRGSIKEEDKADDNDDAADEALVGDRSLQGGKGSESPERDSSRALGDDSAYRSGGLQLSGESSSCSAPADSSPRPAQLSASKRPPRVAPLNLSCLAAPSPITIQADRATVTKPLPGGDSGREETAQLSKAFSGTESSTVLENWLAYIGLQDVFAEMVNAELELEKKAALSVPPAGPTSWAIDLNDLKSEELLTQWCATTAYVNTWQVSEARCDRYARKLGNLIETINFEQLNKILDGWVINLVHTHCSGQTSAGIRLMRQVFEAQKDAAAAVSRKTWKESFSTKLAEDLIRLTNVNVTTVKEALLKYEASLHEHERTLVQLEQAAEEENRGNKTRSNLVQKWQRTLNYYRELKGEYTARDELVRAQVEKWREEIEVMRAKISAEEAKIEADQKRRARMDAIISRLNAARWRSTIAEHWNPIRLSVGLPSSPSILFTLNEFGIGVSGNPYLLINQHLYKISGKNPAMKVAELREQALAAAVRTTAHRGLGQLAATMFPPLSFLMSLKDKTTSRFAITSMGIGADDIMSCINGGHDNFNFDAASAVVDKIETKNQRAGFLLTQLLTAMRTSITTTMTDCINATMRASGSRQFNIDLVSGIIWFIARAAFELIQEILQIDAEYEAFGAVRTVVRYNSEIDWLSEDMQFIVYIQDNGLDRPTMTLKIPTVGAGRIEIIYVQLDISEALKRTSLLGGATQLALKPSYDSPGVRLVGDDLESLKGDKVYNIVGNLHFPERPQTSLPVTERASGSATYSHTVSAQEDCRNDLTE